MSIWLGTLYNSGHHPSVSTQWACHRTHWLLLPRDGSGILGQSGSSSFSLLAWDSSSPLTNSSTWGSNISGHPKSSAFGCDQPICVIALCHFHLPRIVAGSHGPLCSDYTQRLPIALSIMGLETGSSSLKVLHCTDLQPWTFFSDGCVTTYDFLTASGFLIASSHGWQSNSISLSYVWGGPWPPMPACGHLRPQLGPLHMTSLLYPWSGHRWHGSFAGI